MTQKEKIELTPRQAQAFRSFKKAFNRCIDSGIIFYTVLDTMSAINGKHVVDIMDDNGSAPTKNALQISGLCLPEISHYSIAGWADDRHFVVLRGEPDSIEAKGEKE